MMESFEEVSKNNVNIERHAELNPFLEPRSSVKIKRDKKNNVSWEIKLVSGDEKILEELMFKALEFDKRVMNSIKKEGESNGKTN